MNKTPHLHLNKALINQAEYAIIPGDPDRVPVLAKAIDTDAHLVMSHRGYVSYLAYLHGVPILVCSTGIGGASASIVIEELAECGIKHFLRVGTCGAIQPHIDLGDLIIIKASIRLDGASKHFAPIEYPAVASMHFTHAIISAAENITLPIHTGIAVSSDTFYPGQERYDTYTGYVPKHLQGSMEEWQRLNAACYEMETSTLFTMCSTFGLDAACFCVAVANRSKSESLTGEGFEYSANQAKLLMVDSLKQHLIKRGIIDG